MAFYHSILLSNTSFICNLCHFSISWIILVGFWVSNMNQHDYNSILLLFLEKSERKHYLLMDQKRDPLLRIFPLFLNLHARWKGTGEPCSKFFSKFHKRGFMIGSDFWFTKNFKIYFWLFFNDLVKIHHNAS